MKKIFNYVAAAVFGLSMTSCGGLGSTLGSDLGNQVLGSLVSNALTGNTGNTASNIANTAANAVTGNSGSLLGNIISTFASGIMTNQSSLVGTWTYTQPCVQFESESLLSKAGGAVAANTVESKLATYYEKVGIKKGSFKFAFDEKGQFQYAIGSKTATGTYTFNSSNNTVTLTTQTGVKITAYVSISLNQMGLTFDASKLLSLVSSAGTQVSSLSTISSLAGSFSGMKLGFEFAR